MGCISSGYFSHYLLLQNYRLFPKRESEIQQHIYISTPATFVNNKDTTWTDLSEHGKKEEKIE